MSPLWGMVENPSPLSESRWRGVARTLLSKRALLASDEWCVNILRETAFFTLTLAVAGN